MTHIPANLTDVPATLLIPLVARSHETALANGIIHDPRSTEILGMIRPNAAIAEVSIWSQKGVAVRTEILDELTKAFLSKQPEGVVVNLGCGLDTRFARLNNHKVTWYDLDMPEVIAIRRHFFPENKQLHLISQSVMDFTWHEIIPKDSAVLFIAEGLLMYFREEEVRALLTMIAQNFPTSEIIFEAMSPLIVKNATRHPDVKKYQALFQWGIKTGREIENWGVGAKFINEYFYNRHLDKMPLKMRLMYGLPFFKKAMKIIHLKFN